MQTLPLHKAFTLLEPGPVVLVTTRAAAEKQKYQLPKPFQPK